jgi:hypothetical protein
MMRTSSRAWLLLPMAVAVSGCGPHSVERRGEGTELSSARSPDGQSKAFVWMPQSDGGLGATVSTYYQVWIQDLQHDQSEQLLLNADKTTGLRMVWSAPTELQICYVEAQISRFRNFFSVFTRDMSHVYSVEIVLRKVPRLMDCQV